MKISNYQTLLEKDKAQNTFCNKISVNVFITEVKKKVTKKRGLHIYIKNWKQ